MKKIIILLLATLLVACSNKKENYTDEETAKNFLEKLGYTVTPPKIETSLTAQEVYDKLLSVGFTEKTDDEIITLYRANDKSLIAVGYSEGLFKEFRFANIPDSSKIVFQILADNGTVVDKRLVYLGEGYECEYSFDKDSYMYPTNIADTTCNNNSLSKASSLRTRFDSLLKEAELSMEDIEELLINFKDVNY